MPIMKATHGTDEALGEDGAARMERRVSNGS
jgi:hypothetical protein